ncbi:TIGR01244 family sulfur transferase [Yoonia sp.]|uniref:TIGR01244 family sulfur transferase n=1 Tax=Yoonia sp. TaxID=2212373 RepID=UPI0025EF62A7|nr:TIGR01244 family sulfur transferase [Yoonia sp.]
MDIRQITPDYAVSPQIDPGDIAAIKAAGFTTVICNRPDAEVPPSHHAAVMADAARDAGLTFVVIPVTHQGLNAEIVAAQKHAMDTSAGPVLAYCASGTRSSIVWSLSQATERDADQIIAATAAAGYDLGGLRPQLAALAAAGQG